MNDRDDVHVFACGLTRAGIRAAVIAALVTVAVRKRRSEENCRYVRELLREREPRIAAAYDNAVANHGGPQ